MSNNMQIVASPGDGYQMVLVPAGKAVFGTPAETASEDEAQPQFEAFLPDYHLGLNCVTNAQYAAFLNDAGPAAADLESWILLYSDCHIINAGPEYRVDDPERYGDHPVVQVSWYGARAYCEWAGLRLPLELEWEKAARGSDGRVYPWGSGWEADRCRHAGNRAGAQTCAVGQYTGGTSPWGLNNMSGNVWEWCADWWAPDAYGGYAAGDLAAPREGGYKVARGGSWNNSDPRYFRCTARVGFAPEARYFDVGFRCAK